MSSFCYEGVCLDPGGDEDDDNLINASEKELGTDAFDKDTDQDGAPDDEEVGDNLAAPRNSDGDGGLHDALESEVDDADGDCIPNQYDPDDATPRVELLTAACLTLGVCAHPDAELGLACPAGADAPVCEYGAVPAWEATETTCDGRDNDCDGAVDVGDLCDDGDPCTLDTCVGAEGCLHEQTANLPRLARWVPPGLGDARSVLLGDDDVVVVAAGAGGLQTFDAADPDLVGLGSAPVAGISERVALVPNANPPTAVVAAGDAGLHVITLGDPTAPTALGQASLGELAWAHDVVVEPPWAWVASGEVGLSTVDIGAFDAPTVTSQLALPGPAVGVARGPDHLFVAAGDAGLRVLDVTSSTAPSEVGDLAPSVDGWSHGVAVAGDVAFLAHGAGGLVVCDASDPSSPYQLAALPVSGLATDVALADDGVTLWLTAQDHAVLRVDISAPSEPVVLGVTTVAGARAVWPDGDGLLVAASEALLGFSVEDGEPLATSGRTFGRSLDVATDEVGRAVVAQGQRGVEVLLSTDGGDDGDTGIVRTGALGLQGRAAAVDVVGEQAWLAVGDAGLVGVALGQTGAPTFTGEVNLDGEALDVALAGPTAFVALGADGLRLVDVSDPSDPTPLLVTLPSILDAARVAVNGPVAAVADPSVGVHLLDVTAPASPITLPIIELPEGARDVALDGELAVIAAGDDGVVVVDLTTPATASVVGTLALPGEGSAERVWILDGVAWVAWQPLGLWAVDIGLPEAPTTLGLEGLHVPEAMVPNGVDAAWLGQADAGVAVLAPVCPGN